jgi:hypothetical protein
MDADWEVEIGSGAPVIEAEWPGFVDLHAEAGRIEEIAEAAEFPPLAALLLKLNAAESPVWTSKCDVWEPEPGALAIYIDMLPRDGKVFAEWRQGEEFCREHVARLAGTDFPKCEELAGLAVEEANSPAYTIELIVRQAIAGEVEGFGVTAYLGARAATADEAAAGRMTAAGILAAVMAGFADALPPAEAGSKLQ